MKRKVLISWSGGKDSALALDALGRDGAFEVAGLLTTVTEDYQRISMHGIRRVVLEAQARSLGLPLNVVLIPKDSDLKLYERRMRETLDAARGEGVDAVAVGDIFLEGIRRYREEKLAQAGLKAVFPIWKRDTRELSREFIARGFKAFITCVDTQALDGSFSGRSYDDAFLADLPPTVDPCGENGEFHSCVVDCPIFSRPVRVARGETVLRDNRFQFCDLLLETGEAEA